MNQKPINSWFKTENLIEKNEITKKKFKKYCYLNWNNYDDYSLIWSDIKPIEYNYEKTINLRGYKESINFIGNIKYNKETSSFITQKKNFTTANTSFLKSHLQKCIRLGYVHKSIITAYLLMEYNIIEFLRRLPIIILEDVHIIQDLDIIIWFMVMSDSITIPESFKKWIFYLIKVVCMYDKKNYYNKEIKEPCYNDLDKLEDRNKSTIYSLMVRLSYGGMKGDMKMIKFIINDWIPKLANKNCKLKIINAKNIIVYKTLEPNLYELSAVDFHCYPQILSLIQQYFPKFNEKLIKDTIWLKSSSKNFREKEKLYSNDIEDCWNTIKEKLYKIQKKYIINIIKI